MVCTRFHGNLSNSVKAFYSKKAGAVMWKARRLDRGRAGVLRLMAWRLNRSGAGENGQARTLKRWLQGVKVVTQTDHRSYQGSEETGQWGDQTSQVSEKPDLDRKAGF